MRLRLTAAGLVFFSALTFTACERPEAKKARYLAHGRKFLEAKDYSRAILEFQNAAAAVPGDADAQYQLGKVYMTAGDMRSATLHFQRATELNPSHAGAQLMLARQMAQSGDKEQISDARERALNVLSASPDNTDAVQMLAFTEFELGKPGEAERELRQALSRFPKSLTSSVSLANLLLARKDLAGAEAVLKTAASQAPDSAEAAVALAALYAMAGRLPAAEEQIGRALKIDPKNGPALFVLAGIQLNSGRAEDAEKSYKQLSALPAYKSIHAAYLFQAGQTSRAISEFEALAAADPADMGLRHQLLSAYQSAGKYVEAEQLLAAVLRKQSNDPDALYRRGELHLMMGHYAEAQTDVNTLLQRYSRSADAHYLLARIYRETGAAAKRTRELQEALRLSPDLLKARLELAQDLIDSKSPKAALDVLNEAPKTQQQMLPVILKRDWALLAMGDFPELNKGLTEASAAGNDPEMLLISGMAQLEMQKPAAARPLLEAALRGNPDDLRILRALIRCYLSGNETQAGSATFNKYAADRPKSPWAQQTLGEWLALTGSPAEARKAFDAAIALNQKFRPAYLMLVHLDITEGNPAAAREKLSRLLAIYDNDAPAHHQLAGLEYAAGDVAAALTHYKRAVELDPSNVDALNDMAYVLLLSGHTDEAMTYAQAAQEKAPDNGAVLDTLGWALYNKAIYRGAVEQLEKAVAKGGGAVSRYHLAMAYMKTGDIDLGEQALEAALKIDPTIPEATMARQLIMESLPSK